MTSNRRTWVYLTIAVAAIALGVWLMALWLPGLLWGAPRSARSTADASQTPAATTGGAAGARHIVATLFYLSAEGDSLIPVEQDVPYAAAPADQARFIVERQLAAAPAGRQAVIPSGTSLRALFLTSRGEAYVDVSKEIVDGHPGGSLNEALTVYAIVNALTANLPEITAVQVLVDGHEVDTLVGHLDLRQPLRRGTRWVQHTP